MAIAQTASTPNKADFIRAQPPGTSDADVVTNAKREGLVLDERYVRKVRNKARASGSAPSTSAQQDSPDSSGAPLTKADFIRARPGMSAANIVAAAKKAGITMSAQLVHNLRARERATAPKRKRGRPPRRTSAEAGKTAASKPAQVRKPRPVAKVVAMVEGSHAETPATGADDVARAPTRSVAITHARSAVASVASRGVPTTMPSSENMLRAAIAEVGLERAFVILEQERERVRALMGR